MPRTDDERRGSQPRPDEARTREAKRILDRVEVDSESLGTSSLARAGRHFAGADADQDDRIEVWGKRIGRVASLVALVVLLFVVIGQLRS